jgi:hypothetical protein
MAAIEPTTFGSARIRDLQEGRSSLAHLLAGSGVEKRDVRVDMIDGTGRGQDGPVVLAAEVVPIAAGAIATRRYHITIHGAPAGVVVEALPCATWERMAGVDRSSSGRPG